MFSLRRTPSGIGNIQFCANMQCEISINIYTVRFNCDILLLNLYVFICKCGHDYERLLKYFRPYQEGFPKNSEVRLFCKWVRQRLSRKYI